MTNTNLILRNAPLIFSDIRGTKFSPSITIEVTPSNKPLLDEFYSQNKIGKESTPSYKTYTTKDGTTLLQLTFKLSKFFRLQLDSTEYTLETLPSNLLYRGTILNLSLTTYNYDNSFGKGTSCYINAAKVVSQPTKHDVMSEL